jgi:host factor-I protein
MRPSFNSNLTPWKGLNFSSAARGGLVTMLAMPLKSPVRQRRKSPPPGETGQESLYLRFLSEKQVPVTVKLRDGEVVYGWIEYFDDRMIRLTREGKPNLFIYKNQIRTIAESFRSIEARRRDRQRGAAANGVLVPAGSDGMPTPIKQALLAPAGADGALISPIDSHRSTEEPAGA